MSTYKTQTITGSATCYQYGVMREFSVHDGLRRAAIRHAMTEWNDDDPEQIVVVVRGDRSTCTVFIVDQDDEGEVQALRAVHGSARRVLRKLLGVIKDIEQMTPKGAESFMLMLESIYLDTCVIAELKDEHPATSALTRGVSLNAMDLLDGVRLFVHSTWDINLLNHDTIDDHGGFSPPYPREDAP